MGQNGVLGVVVPISDERVMHDVFHGRSFHATLAKDDSTDLEKGDRMFFYDSGKTRQLVGEAMIASITFREAKDVLEQCGGKLYLDADAFDRYVSSLPEGQKSLLRVLRFEDPTVYAAPVKCSVTIPEGGLDMTAEIFAKISKDNT
ncbi:MAG: hypothetical protein OK455_00305 [Thaumarchaeota archaeon]|nr:hypothetical protein [Nitrososphaerota archaeon]